MKKIFLFMALGTLFASCDIGGDESGYVLDLVPVSSVNMPADFAKDSITEIPVKYIRPTSCHFFDSFYYDKSGFNRTVAIYCAQSIQGGCQVDNATEIEVNLRFKPTELGTYHFKFLTSQSNISVPQYLEYDVVVDH